jgi:uncharacterized protein (TIGR03083 family)
VGVTLDDLQVALDQASRSVIAFLRGHRVNAHALTACGEWTVRDTAAHLIGITRLYTQMLDGQASPLKSLDDVVLMNAGIFLGLVEDRPSVLADLVDDAVNALLMTSRGGARDDRRPFHFGGTTTVARLVAAPCYEYLLHGVDMMWAVGQPWSCPEQAATTTFAFIFLAPSLAARFDAHKAHDVDATFSVGVDDVTRFCVQIRTGAIELLLPGADTDCSVTGAASQLLLWLSGRSDWEKAGLSATGRRADLAPLVAELLVN